MSVDQFSHVALSVLFEILTRENVPHILLESMVQYISKAKSLSITGLKSILQRNLYA